MNAKIEHWVLNIDETAHLHVSNQQETRDGTMKISAFRKCRRKFEETSIVVDSFKMIELPQNVGSAVCVP